MTEPRGRVVNTPASYSGGPGFKSPSRDRLSWLSFIVGFISPSRQMSAYYLKLIQDRFLPHPFQFIIYLLPFHSMLYILSLLKTRL
jgi:hypothetical protein